MFDEMLPSSNNIRSFRPTLAQPYCFEIYQVDFHYITLHERVLERAFAR